MGHSLLIWAKLFLLASAAIPAGALVCLCIRLLRKRLSPKSISRSGIGIAVKAFLTMLLAIWSIRLAIGLHGFVSHVKDISKWSVGKELANSFFQSLRAFGIDEEFSVYIDGVKALLSSLITDKSCHGVLLWRAGLIYATVLDFGAALVSVTLILEVLSNVFPRFRLLLGSVFPTRKHYFSELNEASLALAKSIREKSAWAQLIFAVSGNVDEKDEKYELLQVAKRYRAICIRDDILHLNKRGCGEKEFHLMSENELENLQTLIGLTDERNLKYVVDSTIYFFVQTDAYTQVEKRLHESMSTDERRKEILERKVPPVLVPVRGYRNLVCNLFGEVPLYEPLVHKKDSKKLELTIFGNGTIGTEAFLNAYWMGQMMTSEGDDFMTPCELTIHVISQDEEADFWAKINYVNPEIKQTACTAKKQTSCAERACTEQEQKARTEEEQRADELLVCDDSGNQGRVYCDVTYQKANVKNGGFWEGDMVDGLDSDYFIVALGTDEDNIAIAEKLRRAVGEKHLKDNTCQRNTVIAYAVFDSEIAATLNRNKLVYSCGERQTIADIYMYAFGSLEQVYNCDNVYMSTESIWATEIGKAYDASHNSEMLRHEQLARTEKWGNYEDQNYKYWANLARAMHMKYKLFSLGWIETSVFDEKPDEQGNTDHREKLKELSRQYRRLVVSLSKDHLQDTDGKKYSEIESKKHFLAWLEHRRWCAFTRTMGYRYIPVQTIFDRSGVQKDMSLRLHACLVETRLPEKGKSYILADFNAEDGKVNLESLQEKNVEAARDRLDQVSHMKYGKPVKTDDFKIYDYYRYELRDFRTENDILQELRRAKVYRPKRFCGHAHMKDGSALQLSNQKEYWISVEAVKAALRSKYKLPSVDAKNVFEFGGAKFQRGYFMRVAVAVERIFRRGKKQN